MQDVRRTLAVYLTSSLFEESIQLDYSSTDVTARSNRGSNKS